MGILHVVATPIGNLKDITLRALEAFKKVDLILAEDTRVTRKLLTHFEIKKPIIRYDEYTSEKICSEILDRLKRGENIALVTDAGTPTISDPGSRLVSYVMNHGLLVKIVPIPGPSALTAALSVSGINASQFTFLGYPPHKKGRETFFKKIKETEIKPVVFYESPHRIKKTLDSLKDVFGINREILIARELTKIHEEVFKGDIGKAISHFQDEHQKGEFVLIVP